MSAAPFRKIGVDMFEKMYKAGTELPPIMLGKLPGEEDLILVDGRTRRQAREQGNFKDISAYIREYATMTEMIVDAFKANVGGAMPPTQADIIHTLDILLEKGMSRKSIIEEISADTGYPPTLIRKYLDDAQSGRKRRSLNAAVNALTEGNVTVSEAAAKYDVDAGSLRSALTGKKREEKPPVRLITSGISSRFKIHSFKNAATLKAVAARVDEGSLSRKDVDIIIKHCEHLIKREQKVVEEWKARLLAKFR
jgi:hypothetical protein